MASPIEDYAILSNYRPAAVISRDGSIDWLWLWLPRSDSTRWQTTTGVAEILDVMPVGDRR